MKMVFVNDGKMKLMQFSVQPTDLEMDRMQYEAIISHAIS
jgi:hypothetical protein